MHNTFGDYTPRQKTVGFLESYVHGGTTTNVQVGRDVPFAWLQAMPLTLTVDYNNNIPESNENNNTARIAIDLHVNDNSRANAYDVGTLSSPISYDEFVFHRRCGPFERVTHRLLTFGNGLAFLAWAHWCFVRQAGLP